MQDIRKIKYIFKTININIVKEVQFMNQVLEIIHALSFHPM